MYLAAELAQQGVDEILLTDVGYPTVGKLDKIDYNGADRAASIRLFLEELRSALGEYGVAVSIELPPESSPPARRHCRPGTLGYRPAGGPSLRRHHG